MTQEEMDKERAEKERVGIKYIDVQSPGKVQVRIFADGTGYALGGFGGRYVKYAATGIWDYDAPDASLRYSHADKEFAEENEVYTKAWKSIQR